jgi:PKD repeat protein
MINTQGFEVVAEVKEIVLLNILRQAWKSGGDGSGEGVIPEYRELPPGMPLGPYQLEDGTVQVLQDQAQLRLNPAINGVDLTLGTIIHLGIADPPVPSATFFDLTADIEVSAPIGNVDGSRNLGLLFTSLPANAVRATLTSGDPVAAIIDTAVEEYVRQLFRENGDTFPHVIEDIPVNVPPFSMQASIQFFDDESDPARRISVVKPAPNRIQVNVPCHLRFYNIQGSFNGFGLASPMGVLATMRITADYQETPGHIAASLSTAGVELVNILPAPGVEGSNYTANAALVDLARTFDPTIPPLEDAIIAGFTAVATPMVQALPDVDIDYPTVAEIEAQIAAEVRQELEERRFMMLWQPETEDSEFDVDDVTAKVLTEVLAIALNGGAGANANALANFVPAGADFATIVDGAVMTAAFDTQLAEQFPNGFPHRLDPADTDGRKVDLNSLNITLVDGAIRVTGSVTIIDAILGSIDVGATFRADFGLRWIDGPDGGQTIEPFLLGDPDVTVNLSFLGWLLAILLGFLTGGFIGAIIAVVIVLVAQAIASRIGGGMFRDAISNQMTGIGAWPNLLENIGTIDARFHDPIDIFHNGIRVRGSMTVTSTFALTTIDFANSHGPYLQAASQPVPFDGGAALPESSAFWVLGDGHSSSQRTLSHRYGDSGLYVAKLRVQVNQAGGATTRHFARVLLENVPPTVTLGPTITVQEGEEFEIVGSFTDPEWLDTHTARFDFGDNSKPVAAEVEQTNDEPAAQGTARARHTYCDNGTYTVRLLVEDDDGGIGEATMQVIVENVPPAVELPESLCALVGQPVVLRGSFTDPGWCDTHTALWEFGDCQEGSGIVTESHEPPEGRGIVEACHVYERCGRYNVRLRVIDDDGGVGEAEMVVHAVQLGNPHLEDGFRVLFQGERNQAIVANEWDAYAVPFATLDANALDAPRDVQFQADEFVVRDGQRAQRIGFRGAMQGGIYQTLCVNEGWDYELSGRYHLPGRVTGKARIGIDPLGGSDPAAAHVVWVEGDAVDVWRPLAVRATARAGQITLFLGGVDRHGGINTIYWDRVHLCLIQPFCPLLEEEPEPPCSEVCVDFNDLPRQAQFSEPFMHQDLRVTPLGEAVWSTLSGEPHGRIKLGFPRQGVRFDLPAPVDEVTITVNNYAGRLLHLAALVGETVVQAFPLIVHNEVQTVPLIQAGMTAVVVSGGENEAAVVELCFCRPRSPRREPDQPPAIA